jgi:hypothetical protein
MRIFRIDTSLMHDHEESDQGTNGFNNTNLQVSPREDRSIDQHFRTSIFEFVCPVPSSEPLVNFEEPLLELRFVFERDDDARFFIETGSLSAESSGTEDIAGFKRDRLSRRQFHQTFRRLRWIPGKRQSSDKFETKINDENQNGR